MKNLKLLILIIASLFTANVFGQVPPGKGENGALQFEGTIEAKGKNNFQLSECISGSAMIMGVQSKTNSEKEASDSAFVSGEYGYSYYVDDYVSPAGEIKFRFVYIIGEGVIKYRFFDFEHGQSDSKFSSIGRLPLNWNEKVKNAFSEKQYGEIMTDINLNVANAVRMIKKYCIN